ncbi:MAG: NAD-dependent epimerase/dehydratase family protein [Lachnospiraceae bacterium]|nr:NAD-dependent epimerase/dehydratase family protein [Lachnospiraceae bacterium]
MSTIKLLDVCVKRKVRIIFFSSGGTVCGEPHYLPIDEDHPTNPKSAYGIHKLTVEKILEYYGYTYNLDYIILRVSNPYGAGQAVEKNQGVISVFIRNISNGLPIEVWGDGKTIRDYIFIDDVIEACKKMIFYNGETRVFNVGEERGYTIEEIVQMIQKELGRKIEIVHKEGRIQDVSANVLDCTRIKSEVSWNATIELKTGIKQIINSTGDLF